MLFAERFAAEGWLQISGNFDPGLIDEIRAEFERQFADLPTQGGNAGGYREVGDERLMFSLKLQGPLLDSRVYANPLLLMVLRQLLGGEILIDNFTCVVALAGAAEQELHQDHPPLFPQHPELLPILDAHAITVIVPLIDLSEETGTTKLFPGTHRGTEIGQAESPYIRRGDCFLMDYRLQHQGTANRSSGHRPVLYIVYARPWFTDSVNFRKQPRINMDVEDLQKIAPEHRLLFRRLDLADEELATAG